MTKKMFLMERYFNYCKMVEADYHTLLEMTTNKTADPETVNEVLVEARKIQTLKTDIAMKLATMGCKESELLDNFMRELFKPDKHELMH